MPRPRIYNTNADRQRAYRERERAMRLQALRDNPDLAALWHARAELHDAEMTKAEATAWIEAVEQMMADTFQAAEDDSPAALVAVIAVADAEWPGWRTNVPALRRWRRWRP